jgi:hypothetical protein
MAAAISGLIERMRTLSAQMSTTGGAPLPRSITLGQGEYALSTVFKDDFFATTALYCLRDGCDRALPQRVILKTGRSAPFFGLPLRWLGRLLASHELAVLGRLQDIRGIPKVLGRYDATSFLYEYIPGWTLDQKPGIPDHLFEQLHDLVSAVHSRKVAYVDMNKRGNIIVGDDCKPHLIDFQISLYLPGPLLVPLRNTFRSADFYHLCKHKIRFVPHLATTRDRWVYRHRGLLIDIHRFVTAPYRKVRRGLFRYLYSREILTQPENATCSHENNPARFLR